MDHHFPLLFAALYYAFSSYRRIFPRSCEIIKVDKINLYMRQNEFHFFANIFGLILTPEK